ncbi:MAG: UvrD-helicase domain-containing protein, partial [Clostridia bacterium]|nr:UvrD-helicase domain-containing protein [Clostridia bacterium]
MNLDLQGLNEVQRQAVECTQGACIVSAGAGSGKTRVLTYRVANLIMNLGVDSRNILAITFTNKAAREMKERLNLMLGVHNAQISTFHALGVRILRECYKYLLPRNKNFTIYDETDKKNLIKKIVKDIDPEDKMIDTYIENISKAKNNGIYPENYQNVYGNYQISQMTQKVYQEYEIQMEKNNAYDFDDLLCKVYDLLLNNLTVREYYASKFQYILVDEFQDTNEIQYKLLKILQSKHHNIFVVGDEDQSIYSWRGADSKNMLKFIRDFGCTQIFKLEQNYRSTEKILEAANTIISKNTGRLDKNLWTEKKGGVRVEYRLAMSEQNEAEFIASTIHSLIEYGSKHNDIAILCRMNALSRVLEDKLLGYNIPYKVYGGVKFYDRTEVKNILAYLKCIVNHRDDESFLRIVNFPKRKIGDVALANLKSLSPSDSYMEILYEINQATPIPSAQLKNFFIVKDLFDDLKKKSQEMTVSKLVEYLLDKIDIQSIYDQKKEEELSRLMNIKELVASIREFEKQNEGATLEEYIQAVTLISDIDSYEEEEDAVTIATVHAVKGLEFKNVFIIGLEEGIFPLI